MNFTGPTSADSVQECTVQRKSTLGSELGHLSNKCHSFVYRWHNAFIIHRINTPISLVRTLVCHELALYYGHKLLECFGRHELVLSVNYASPEEPCSR